MGMKKQGTQSAGDKEGPQLSGAVLGPSTIVMSTGRWLEASLGMMVWEVTCPWKHTHKCPYIHCKKGRACDADIHAQQKHSLQVAEKTTPIAFPSRLLLS